MTTETTERPQAAALADTICETAILKHDPVRSICSACLLIQRYGNEFCVNCESRALRRASNPVAIKRKIIP